MLCAIKEKVFVNFIGQDEKIVLFSQSSNLFNLRVGENFAAGIRWRIDDNGPRTRSNSRAQRVKINFPGMHRQRDGLRLHAQA